MTNIMKNNTHRDRIFGICAIFILLTLSSVINCNIIYSQENQRNNYKNLENKKITNLKSAINWKLTGSPIFIDDSDPSRDWVFTAANYAWCTGSGSWNDPYRIENVTISGTFENGIYINNSKVHFIIKNNTITNCLFSYIGYNNNVSGIWLNNVSNGIIMNNNVSSNEHGIYLVGSSNNTIINNFANNNLRQGLVLYYSSNNTIHENTFVYNLWMVSIWFSNFNNFSRNIITQSLSSIWRELEIIGFNNSFSGNNFTNCGIYISPTVERPLNDLSSHSIDTTNLVNGKPIYYYVKRQFLTPSKFLNAGQVILINCNNSAIFNLNITNGGSGIMLYYCNNITIFNNDISNQGYYGIFLYKSSQNIIAYNTILTTGAGIKLISSSRNNFSSNQFLGLSSGIIIDGVWNIFQENTFRDNSFAGIKIQWGGDMHNVIKKNNFSNNYYGIFLMGKGNTVYLNNFISNTINAYDYGEYNYYDNGTIGNYWDNYSGKDANDDGIGDTPHLVPGSYGNQDNYSIWWDAPVYIVTSPNHNEIFSENAPEINITITEGVNDTVWYTIDGGLTNFTCKTNDTVNQTAWNNLENGNVPLTIFMNDSRDFTSIKNITILKDTLAPIITINSPTLNQTYGIEAPLFDIQIIELSLVRKWYSLNDGQNITFKNQVQFDQVEWDKIEDGIVLIKFFAIDALGRIGMNSITVKKLSPSTIPGYDLILLIGIVSIMIVLSKKITKFHKKRQK